LEVCDALGTLRGLHSSPSAKKNDGQDGRFTKKSNTVTVWIFRHGQRMGESSGKERDAWARDVRLEKANADDDPLTEKGFAQAEMSAAHFRRGKHGKGVRCVHTSPLQRCCHTAEAFARALGIEIHIVAGLGACAQAMRCRGLKWAPSKKWFAFEHDGRGFARFLKKGNSDERSNEPNATSMLLDPSTLRTRFGNSSSSRVRWNADGERDFSILDKKYLRGVEGFKLTLERLSQDACARVSTSADDAQPTLLVCSHREGIRSMLMAAAKPAASRNARHIQYASLWKFEVSLTPSGAIWTHIGDPLD